MSLNEQQDEWFGILGANTNNREKKKSYIDISNFFISYIYLQTSKSTSCRDGGSVTVIHLAVVLFEIRL